MKTNFHLGNVPVAFGQSKLSGSKIISFSLNWFSSIKFEINETGVINASGNSGALGLPVGVTSDRPEVSQAGYTRWNSDAGAMEIYTGNEWVEVITDYFPSGSVVFD